MHEYEPSEEKDFHMNGFRTKTGFDAEEKENPEMAFSVFLLSVGSLILLKHSIILVRSSDQETAYQLFIYASTRNLANVADI